MVIFFKIVTQFGGVWAVLAVGSVVLAFLGLRECIRFGTTVGAAVGFGLILKVIFKNPRPDVSLALVRASGYSFPSLHTLTAVVLALYIFFTFVWRSRLAMSFKAAAAVGLAIAAGLVGWSRVYLGVHFWEDVFAGAAFGAALYFLLTFLFDKLWKLRLSRRCRTLTATKRLAHAFVKAIQGRGQAIVLFDAVMGAGKTTFIREAVLRLGARVQPASPTFSVINQYRENIFHADLYRLESAAELENTDFYEILHGKNFVFIEWAEKFGIDYPAGAIWVKINVEEDGSRVFNITY